MRRRETGARKEQINEEERMECGGGSARRGDGSNASLEVGEE